MQEVVLRPRMNRKYGIAADWNWGETTDGLMVQRDDTALAWRKSGFDSRSVHCNTEGIRIGEEAAC